MSDKELTHEDIDLLLKALNAYQQEPVNEGMKEMMIASMLTPDKVLLERESKRIIAKAQADTRKLEEVIILLKAKLINLRDSQTVAQMSAVLKGE